MRDFSIIFLILIFFAGVSLSTFAKDDDKKAKVSESTIASLLMGLNSDNIGLKSSCAYMLGELRVASAVVPLMRLLHNDENDEIRISAALALYKIGTPISIQAVKQAIRFDPSIRVSKLAQKFYNEYTRADLKKNNRLSTEKDFVHTD